MPLSLTEALVEGKRPSQHESHFVSFWSLSQSEDVAQRADVAMTEGWGHPIPPGRSASLTVPQWPLPGLAVTDFESALWFCFWLLIFPGRITEITASQSGHAVNTCGQVCPCSFCTGFQLLL